MVQGVESLLLRLRGLSSGPQHPNRNHVPATSPLSEGQRWVSPGPHWPARLAEMKSSRFKERLCLKKDEETVEGGT